MKILKRFAALSILALSIFSCQKEVSFEDLNLPTDPGNPGSTVEIIGEWDFISLEADTRATIAANESGHVAKSVTTSHYLTENNSGTASITSSEIQFHDVAYDINTTVSLQSFLDGVLVSDDNFPWLYSSPGTNSTSPYVRNSADSITLQAGSFEFVNDPANPTPTVPTGLKLSYSGDTLLMRIDESFSTQISQGGSTADVTQGVKGIVRLKRK
jgi:hypothetical protein